MFIELDNFDDCIEVRMLISQRTDDQAACLSHKNIKLLRLGYL